MLLSFSYLKYDLSHRFNQEVAQLQPYKITRLISDTLGRTDLEKLPKNTFCL
jgi:hypothetical protein